eukprot:GFKZ01004626.1.p2 GENE.GFKZ01004626.1~~GFKZ01004626.1.p2  ORF type:complete len:215 (-),score=49.38 GFKZ01004626.1:912-1556(-)
MPPINVLISGLANPLLLHVGSIHTPLATCTLAESISAATGLPYDSFYLRQQGRLLHPCDAVTQRGQHTTFIDVHLRRALPGGKGGFGAMLRGSAARKRTTNFDACRDLGGRRVGVVRREEEMMRAVREGRGRKRERDDNVEDNDPEVDTEEKDEGEVDMETVGEDMKRIGGGVMEAVKAGLGKQGKRRKAAVEIDWMMGMEQEGTDSDSEEERR